MRRDIIIRVFIVLFALTLFLGSGEDLLSCDNLKKNVEHHYVGKYSEIINIGGLDNLTDETTSRYFFLDKGDYDTILTLLEEGIIIEFKKRPTGYGVAFSSCEKKSFNFTDYMKRNYGVHSLGEINSFYSIKDKYGYRIKQMNNTNIEIRYISYEYINDTEIEKIARNDYREDVTAAEMKDYYLSLTSKKKQLCREKQECSSILKDFEEYDKNNWYNVSPANFSHLKDIVENNIGKTTPTKEERGTIEGIIGVVRWLIIGVLVDIRSAIVASVISILIWKREKILDYFRRKRG